MTGDPRLLSLEQLLADIAALGVTLELDGERLRVRAPSRALSEAHRDALALHKTHIVARIRANTSSSPVTVTPRGLRPALSLGQQRIWFLEQLEGGRAVYHVPGCVWIRGPLDVSALAAALQQIVDRHEPLRTTFPSEGGRSWQQIGAATMPLSHDDVSTATDPDGAAHALATTFIREPFDLGRGPLGRALLIAAGADRHLLVISLHHIVSDAWSMGVLLRELNAFYSAALQGTVAPLAPLTIQYADFAQWQRERLSDARRAHLLDYWRAQLAGVPAVLDVPLDRPRPAVASFRGRIERFSIDAPTTTQLRALATSHDATLFQALLAAFHALLYRYSGQDSIVVGTPVANRARPELEPLVGFFVNTLPIRGDCPDGLTFAELLTRVRESTVAAYEHQDLPFDVLVSELAATRSLGHNPIFQCMFALQNAPRAPLQLGPATLEPVSLDLGVAKFDLYLSMQDRGDGTIDGEWEYATDLFDRDTARRMIRHFCSLLRAACERPTDPVTRLPLMDAAEERQLVVDWNRTESPWPQDASLVSLVAAQGAKTPQARAVVDATGFLTYDELERASNRLAMHLRSLGVTAESRVGLCVGRSRDLIVAVLGILKSGAAYVPFDPAYPRERIAFIADDAQLELVVTSSDVATALPLDARHVRLDDDAAAIRACSDAPPDNPPGPERLAYVIYTSGSTGHPKGIQIEHRNAVSMLAWAQTVFAAEDVRGTFVSTSICFDLSVFEIFLPLVSGGTAIVGANALDLASHPAANEVTLLNTVPSAVAELVRSGDIPPSVRIVALAGEPLKASLVDRIYALPHIRDVYDLYGPGETTTYSTYARRAPHGRETIGRPIANTRLYLLDAEQRPVPIGVPGEIYIAGAGVTRGYLHRDELTRARYLSDPFAGGQMYRTGDIGRFFADGDVQYLGRADHQVKIRGFRIEPGEIEVVLQQHKGVGECIVHALDGSPGGKRLVAYYCGTASAAELREHLAGLLPPFLVPSTFVRMAALPLTPNGKVDRRALPEPHTAVEAADDGYVEPTTNAERSLCAIWADVLRAGRVSTTDNFFEVGGDSILAIEVVSRAREAGLTLTPGMLFEHQTVRALAAASAPSRDTVADEEAGEVPLTPVQQWCLAGAPPESHHFAHWVVLDPQRGFADDVLVHAVALLAQRHGALRLRFARATDAWRQWYGDTESSIAVRTTGCASDDLAALASEMAASLDPEHGPIGRATLVTKPGRNTQLLLVFHHLVVDGVSWRILANDLAAICEALESGTEVPPHAHTASFKRWAEAVSGTAVAATPPRTYSTFATSRIVGGAVPATLVEALRSQAAAVYGARLDDVLVAALGAALHQWTATRSVVIDVERHGRDERAAIDTSNTVGWFTSINAVSIDASVEPSIAILSATAACRQARGSPFNTSAPVSFNYLGRTDAVRGWRVATAGLTASPLRPRPHRLAVGAALTGDTFTWHIEYSTSIDDDAEVTRLSALYETQLRELAAHCGQPHFTGHRDLEAITPVSPAQEGILFHALLENNAPGTYVTQIAFDLEGELDVDVFRTAWTAVVRRHAALRSSFLRDQSGNIVQVAAHAVTLPYTVHDCREAGGDAVTAMGRDEHARALPIDVAPLMRVAVGRTGERRWTCWWTCHHAILDGWSMAVVLRDLAALLTPDGNARVQLPQLLPWPSYAGAAVQPVRAEDEAFWTEELAPVTEPVALPWCRTATGAAKHCVHDVTLEPAVTAAVQSYAREHGLTLHSVLQGAWALLLSRSADARVVTFGSTASGRSTASVPGIDAAAGLFMRTVPVVIDVDDAQPVGEWLHHIQRRHVQRDAHAHVPLVRLHELSRLARGTTLFDTLLVLENYPIDAALRGSIGDLRVAGIRVTERPHYGLTLTVSATDAIRISAVFDEHRVDHCDVADIVTRFERVLAALAGGATRVGDVAMLSREEHHRVVVEWNATRRAYPAGTIVDRFEQQVARTPDATAVVFEQQSLTYAELDARASQVAHLLRAEHVEANTLVGVSMPRSLELVIALYGVLKAGAAYVPIDPEYPEARREFMLRDAGPRVVLDRARVVDARQQPTSPVSRTTGPDDLAYMIYTSGSTGRPKGALNTHAGIANRLHWMQEAFPLDATDSVLQKTPFSFDVSVWEFFWPLLNGARLVVARPGGHLDPRYLSDVIAAHRITTLHFVPSMLRAFLDTTTERDCAGVRRVIVSGEALAPDLARRFRDTLRAELHNLYGPTEAAVDVTWWPVPSSGALNVVPIGRPIANTTIYVLDRRGQPLPAGIPGELFIGGVQVGRGYWNRTELTAERFIPDPFSSTPGATLYRTGDRARFLDDGNIECLGRLDGQVKVRGVRIELGEIEEALRADSRVRDAVVTVRDVQGDATLAAYVVADDRSGLVASLRATLRRQLPEAMVPSLIVTVNALPRLPNGKIDRSALPDPLANAPAAPPATRGESERTLAAIWSNVLGTDRFGASDNFFDVGGHSLKMLRVHAQLQAGLGREIPLVALFEHPTIAAMARYLGDDPTAPQQVTRLSRGSDAPYDIAVIGMACRFPGASNVDEFWRNLVDARESITALSDDELLAAGESRDRLRDPRYVRATPLVADAEHFDAAFFDIPPREADILDPQQRVFLECAWEAFERAGYDPARLNGPAGVFAGSGMNLYALLRLQHPAVRAEYGSFPLLIANDKDHLPTRVAYKLNLTGPAVTVQTACSTSLVAITMACESLLRGDCDVALAGGVTIRFPQTGYLYEEDLIFSPDGHTRAFDAEARGVVLGSGAGVVVLKRLDEALADGDHVHAVIKGAAVNNDGAAKVGYTAPGVDGQARVITTALRRANVDPSTIGLVEAHGTATPLGDPIEVAALTRAWRQWTDKTQFCALGSVKTNIGHTDAAAGVAGFIKAVLSIEHATIPASLHFTAPNPRLEIERTPFAVAAKTAAWPGGQPARRAAVSSFGIGGTNAHLILEQAPAATVTPREGGLNLIALSARSEAALEASATQLAATLQTSDTPDLRNVAFTLLDGRHRFAYRRALVADGHDNAVAQLRARAAHVHSAAEHRPVIFLFSGFGAQYPHMARGLYRRFPAFRNAIDRSAAILESRIGDIRHVLFGDDAEALRRPSLAHPALVALQHGLAELWASVGVRPVAVLGSSLGEYAAASLAGVMSHADMLHSVAHRGPMIEAAPRGAMLAVSTDEHDVRTRLFGSLAVAVITAPSRVVLSGTPGDIDTIAGRLAADGIDVRRVNADYAPHSTLMQNAARDLAAQMTTVTTAAPRVPLVSNVTGTWLTHDDVVDPWYWGKQLRDTVQLSSGLELMLRTYPDAVLIEIGAGRSLASAVQQQPSRTAQHQVITSLRHAMDNEDDEHFFLNAVADAWCAGVDLAARGLYPAATRVPLPTYPFERRRFIVSPPSTDVTSNVSAGSLYLPGWERSLATTTAADVDGQWLVVGEGGTLEHAVAEQLRCLGATVVTAPPAVSALAFSELLQRIGTPDRVLYLSALAAASADDALDRAFYGPVYLAQALGDTPCHITIATRHAARVTGAELIDPYVAVAAGPARVIAQEFEHVRTLHLDLDDANTADAAAVIVREAAARITGTAAYRNGLRWTRRFTPLAVPQGAGNARLRPNGTYIITGGVGGVAVELAASITSAVQSPHFVLTSRSIDHTRASQAVSRLERAGATVTLVAADVAIADDVRRVFEIAERTGPVCGVVHAAGIAGGGALALRERSAIESEFAAKITGTRLIYEQARGRAIDFLMLCSSTSSFTGGAGSVAYTAANAFQDAFAQACASRGDGRVRAINWYRWQATGMANEAERVHARLTGERLLDGIAAERGQALFLNALSFDAMEQIAICPHDLHALEQRTRTAPKMTMRRDDAPRVRADTATYAAPTNDTEREIAGVWRDVLGVADVGIDDQFHVLGGDSLLAVRVVSRLRHSLGVNVAVRALYDAPTVAALARHVEALRWARESQAQGRTGGGRDTGVL